VCSSDLERTTFLIDTYDTLRSGIESAIKAGKELTAKGKNFGVRLDSGDIHYLSVEVRKRLDAAGLTKATISVSNDLDEYIIQALKDSNAPVDVWGVGTRMVTGGNEASFTGVYKLCAAERHCAAEQHCTCEGSKGLVPCETLNPNSPLLLSAKMKFSDNPEKTTNPGIKQVWRIKDKDGMCVADVLTLEEHGDPDFIEKGKTYSFWHPSADYRRFRHHLEGDAERLLVKRLENGKALAREKSLKEIQEYVRLGLDSLDQSYKRILNPHVYKVSVSSRLRALKLKIIKTHLGNLQSHE
jgi:nicotinate phosphoribosyltransferase